MTVATETSARVRAGPASIIGLTSLVLGAVLGYGSPAVGVATVVIAALALVIAVKARPGGGELAVLLSIVLFSAMLILLGDLPFWTTLAAALAGGIYWFARQSRRWWVGILPSLALQAAVLAQQWHWGRAAIDVFTTLQTATEHLLQGANPYFFQYQDLAPLPRWHLVQAPFQYGPASLYLGVPGRWLGDVRVLAAAAAAGTMVALVVVARRGTREQLQRTAWLATGLPLFAPLIVNAWVDVYTAAGLAVWWALRDGRLWLLGALALGIGAAAKPVMLVGLLPLLIWDRGVRRDVAVAALAAVALCLPFLVWTGPKTFIYDVAGVHVQVLNQVWPTSITFDALLYQAHVPPIPDLVSIAVLLLSVPVAMAWRPARRDVQLLVAPVFMLAALLLSRQSFLNYYFVVAVWLLLAVAEQPVEASVEPN